MSSLAHGKILLKRQDNKSAAANVTQQISGVREQTQAETTFWTERKRGLPIMCAVGTVLSQQCKQCIIFVHSGRQYRSVEKVRDAGLVLIDAELEETAPTNQYDEHLRTQDAAIWLNNWRARRKHPPLRQWNQESNQSANRSIALLCVLQK